MSYFFVSPKHTQDIDEAMNRGLDSEIHPTPPAFRRYDRRCSVTAFSLAEAAYQAVASLNQDAEFEHDDQDNSQDNSVTALGQTSFLHLFPSDRQSPSSSRRSFTETTLREAARLAGATSDDDDDDDQEDESLQMNMLPDDQVESLKPSIVPILISNDEWPVCRYPPNSENESATPPSVPETASGVCSFRGEGKRGNIHHSRKRSHRQSAHSRNEKRPRIE